MQLLVIRHATAEDVAPDGDDSSRSLTKTGKQEMKDAAAGLRTVVEDLNVIGASPLLRAQQTAEIVAKAYDDVPIDTVDALTPGSDPSALVDWLGQHASADVVAIVGHEPQLGMLVTWFMTGTANSRVEMKKGGAALLDFSSRVAPGSGVLQWVLTRSQLRK